MPTDSQPKRIVLGIGGGIGAIKTPALVRLLLQNGAEVVPVLTANGQRFVTALALQALGSRRPRTDLWDESAEAAMGHIELARWAEAVVVAPATAGLMARLAGGLADDLLTTLCLATTAPVFLAPAMNMRMWQHPATQRNVEQLAADGATLLGPAVGDQACGEFGPGRMLEPQAIADAVLEALAGAGGALAGVHVLVTAGPTREFLDPVRFISNRSSGRQGFAIAEAARRLGADVTLVAGPVHLSTPAGVERVDVVSASQMKAAVAARTARADIFISVAAVADYRPTQMLTRKMKKSELDCDEVRVALEQNDDIVGSIAGMQPRPFVVGFAAETHDALEYARAKRTGKRMDAIVVNDVADESIGFDSQDNAVTLIHDGGELALEKMPKRAVARRLMEEIASLYARPRRT